MQEPAPARPKVFCELVVSVAAATIVCVVLFFSIYVLILIITSGPGHDPLAICEVELSIANWRATTWEQKAFAWEVQAKGLIKQMANADNQLELQRDIIKNLAEQIHVLSRERIIKSQKNAEHIAANVNETKKVVQAMGTIFRGHNEQLYQMLHNLQNPTYTELLDGARRDLVQLTAATRQYQDALTGPGGTHMLGDRYIDSPYKFVGWVRAKQGRHNPFSQCPLPMFLQWTTPYGAGVQINQPERIMRKI